MCLESEKRGGACSDVISEMDFRVGQILDAIQEAGVDHDTIVVLSSDKWKWQFVGAEGGSSGACRDWIATHYAHGGGAF